MPIMDVPPVPVPGPPMLGGSTIFLGWIAMVAGHIFGWLPAVVTTVGGMMAIGWYGLQFYESKTFQNWSTRHSTISKLRKLARLKAKAKIIEAQMEALQVRNEAEEVADAKIAEAKNEAAKVSVETEAKIAAVTAPLPSPSPADKH